MRHEKKTSAPYQQYEIVKKATNLLQLIEDVGHVQPVPAGPNIWQCICPHPDHNEDTPSFFIYHNADGSWTWHCYGCNSGSYDPKHGDYGNDCFAFLQWMSDYHGKGRKKRKVLKPWEACQILAKRAGIRLQKNYGKNAELYRMMTSFSKAYHANLLPQARKYLYSRGLDDTDIDLWSLGFMVFREPDYSRIRKTGHYCSKMVQRITFPISDAYDQVVAFSNRVLHNDNVPKYLITSAVNEAYRQNWKKEGKTPDNSFMKRFYFYGMDKVNTSNSEVLLVEGQMDVILGHHYSKRNILGVFGHSVSDEQIELLKKLNMKTVCLCFDGDAAGEEGIRDNAGKLAKAGFNVKVLRHMPSGMDIADAANEYKDKLDQFLDFHMVSYWQYVMEDAVAFFDAGLAKLRMKVLPYIKKVNEAPLSEDDKKLMQSFIRERFGLFLT